MATPNKELPTTTVKNAQVKVTKITQTANAELESPEKTMYYLIIITDQGKKSINIGEKTFNDITEILKK